MIRIDIINDRTGTAAMGNYDVYVYLPSKDRFGEFVEHAARVENYDRFGGWDKLAMIAINRLAPVVADHERRQSNG